MLLTTIPLGKQKIQLSNWENKTHSQRSDDTTKTVACLARNQKRVKYGVQIPTPQSQASEHAPALFRCEWKITLDGAHYSW